ncbi:MAG: cyanophycinase [Bacteroidetes bacterium]|nr:MAG: cyanophycinase [Bacteroidota bacterium]
MLKINKIASLSLLASALFFTSCSKEANNVILESEQISSNGRQEAAAGYTTYMTGDPADVQTVTTGGTVLMGGSTDVDEAFRWMIQKSGGGDFVVIRVSGADGYNPWVYTTLGGVNSCETIMITSRTIAADPTVAAKIRNAEALFIAGGDQADYVKNWKDTPVEDAINYLINTKKVPVGGTSAGCAIMSNMYYSALNGTITSASALGNPYDRSMTIGNNDFVNNPFLANTISDQHFSQRDRQGRLLTFMARMTKDWSLNAKGIGVDEMTAVLIEADGTAKVVGTNKAYFMQRNNNSVPELCVSKKALTWNNNQQAVKVYEIQAAATVGASGTFSLTNWTTGTNGVWKFLSANAGVKLYQ